MYTKWVYETVYEWYLNNNHKLDIKNIQEDDTQNALQQLRDVAGADNERLNLLACIQNVFITALIRAGHSATHLKKSCYARIKERTPNLYKLALIRERGETEEECKAKFSNGVKVMLVIKLNKSCKEQIPFFENDYIKNVVSKRFLDNRNQDQTLDNQDVRPQQPN